MTSRKRSCRKMLKKKTEMLSELQIGVKEEDRDAFRFLFNVKGEERHLRFTRVPLGVEASPFVLEATLQNHL